MASIKMTMPVVINRCYGGFDLSEQATRYLANLKGWDLVKNDHFLVVKHTGRMICEMVSRNDLDLIHVVRKLGDKANGSCSELEIVDVEIDVTINNFDGMENVAVSGHITY